MKIIIDNKKIPVPTTIFPCKAKDVSKSLNELQKIIVMAKTNTNMNAPL